MSKESLKQEWRKLYSEILPAYARENNWPVHFDHCIARIIYDHVAGAKWDTVWCSPAIYNLSDDNLRKCIQTGKDLKCADLDVVKLNRESLRYRGKISAESLIWVFLF